MFDLSVTLEEGRWILADDVEGVLCAFGSQAEALCAAGEYAAVDREPREVLVREPGGEWTLAVVEPPPYH